MPTKLSAYDIDEAGIEKVIKNLEVTGMTALSETGDLTLDIARKMLITAQ